MSTQTLITSTEFEDFAADMVAKGRFRDATDVLHAAMKALQREECDEQAKGSALVEALADGDASGMFVGDAFASVRHELGLPARA